ncbi:RNA polymerase sigma factor [Rhodobacteraceae bacterium]|nr:RNA polymerase sigma factor [Paracoccaceae bacterium]
MSNDPRDEILDHLPSLRAFAMSLARNKATADDLVQDTMVKALGAFDSFKQGTNMRAWLFTILRNTFYTLRTKQKREVADVDGVMAGQMAEKPQHDGLLALNDFKQAFSQLRDEQREALLLVGASGFSCEEAAQMCGCAPGTIKSRASRGRKLLAELLQMEEGEMPDMTDQVTMDVLHNRPAA